MWSGKRYHSFDHYLKQNFGEKLYKLSLDASMTCPNRDGSAGTGGCIFCSGSGSGDFAARGNDIREQITQAKELVADKFDGSRYIAYFQSFTNTYAPVEKLEKLFLPVINRDDIAVLDIATRPDCLGEDKLELISRLAEIKPVWVELGLQTASDYTAKLINRCYPTEIYPRAVANLHNAGAEVITHMIIGLPGENVSDMLSTADLISKSGSDGIKLQLLHVLKGTKLEKLYYDGAFRTLEFEGYIDIICRIIERLPPDIVIHRLTGDGSRQSLVSPLWSCDKRRVLNRISHELKNRSIIQGCGLLDSEKE